METPKIHRRMKDEKWEFLTNVDLTHAGRDGEYDYSKFPCGRETGLGYDAQKRAVEYHYGLRFEEVKVEDSAFDSNGKSLKGYVAVYIRP